MKRNILWSSIFATSLVFTACQNRETDKKSASNSVQKTTESGDRDDLRGTRPEPSQETAEFEKSIHEKMDRLDAKLVKLDAKGDAKSREMAAEFRARRDELKTKVQQLSDATDDSLDTMETAIESSWNRLESDIDAAL